MIFISLTYAEQAGRLPRTGAIVRYPQLTHGAWTSWIIGWTYWLSAITVPAIEAEAVVTYVGSQAPGSAMETTSHGVAVLTWPNGILFFLGLMAETNRWVTWWKIIIPSITAIFMPPARRSGAAVEDEQDPDPGLPSRTRDVVP